MFKIFHVEICYGKIGENGLSFDFQFCPVISGRNKTGKAESPRITMSAALVKISDPHSEHSPQRRDRMRDSRHLRDYDLAPLWRWN